MKTVTIELFRIEKNGLTCQRCKETGKVIRKVADKMTAALKNMKVELVVKEVPLTGDRLALSNTVRINGRDINKIITEKESFDTECPSCSALLGKVSCCRTFLYQDRQCESLPEQMLEEAILAELPQPTALAKNKAISQVICDCKDECSGNHPL